MTSDRSLFEHAAAVIRERKALALRLAEPGRLVTLHDPRTGKRALCGRDPRKIGGYRATWLDDTGPIGHVEFNTLADAIFEALTMGYLPESDDHRDRSAP